MKTLPALLLAATLAAGPAAAQPTPIAPGYWETTSQVISPFPTKKTEKKCIRAEDIDKFIGGSPNRHYTCTYPTREVANGKIRLAGSCKTKNSQPVPITGEGVFTRDTLRLDAYVKAKVGGLNVPVHARTSGKRIADTCPTETAEK
ncbi:DUF3617 domain-containing protein [Phenylobacterium sp.]|jgi:hypothetical protein|uniref:DUF3617 domain-containing protein n=1 Tax=Phenylobacterium sp. TaxID=1871053 RepID=UPI002F9462F1